jgi:hypothetical protein
MHWRGVWGIPDRPWLRRKGIAVRGDTIFKYQKNGITVTNGASATLQNNTVTGEDRLDAARARAVHARGVLPPTLSFLSSLPRVSHSLRLTKA